MPQPFLHQREQFGIAVRLGIEHAFRGKAGLVKAGRKQVAGAHHPQHRAGEARGDAGHEQGGGGIIGPARTLAGHFVQGIKAQAAPGKLVIDGAKAKGQGCARPAAIAFKGAHCLAQLGWRRDGNGHGVTHNSVVHCMFRLVLFVKPALLLLWKTCRLARRHAPMKLRRGGRSESGYRNKLMKLSRSQLAAGPSLVSRRFMA